MSGPSATAKAHVGEDGGEFVDHLADRMHAAGLGRRLAHRQRDVDGLGGEPRIERGGAERVLGGSDRGGDALLQAVDRRALHLALVRRHRAERLEQRRHRAALAERGHAQRLQRPLRPWPKRWPRAGRIRAWRCQSSKAPDVIVRVSGRSSNPGVQITMIGGYWMPAFAGMTPNGYAGSAALAFSTIAWNAAGSRMARSDSTLRSTISPALASPAMKRL